MRLEDLVLASNSVQKLILQDLPLKTAYALMQLANEINPYLKFFSQEMVKSAPDSEERAELMDFQAEIPHEGFSRIKISLSAPLKLSAADIKFLEPFIEFCPEGQHEDY